jgi:heme O synthase-like polyprenyltransferase
VLIPVSLMVWHQDLAGNLYFTVALMGGVVYLISSVRFLLDQSKERAKQLVLCSIVYLPTVLLTMTWDHYRLLS